MHTVWRHNVPKGLKAKILTFLNMQFGDNSD